MSGAGLLAGRRGLIMGVANNRSIAWGVAKAVADQGAELDLLSRALPLKNGFSRWRPLSNRN